MRGWQATEIPDQCGRVAVVTGGNGGLGFVTSFRLAARGAHVVIGARNLARAEASRRRIEAFVPHASLEIRKLDLASLASVVTFAGETLAAHPKIDLLFNNAGLMAVPEGTTEDGFETQFGTNHLGHFALTMRLMPALLASPAARVVTTTSLAGFYMASGYDLDDPHMRGRYEPWRAYGGSKLANLQFSIELNRRLEGTPVTSFAAEPGGARTGLQSTSVRAMDSLQHRFWLYTMRWFGQPAAKGALPQLRAGTDPQALPGSLYGPAFVLFGPPVLRPVPSFFRRPDQLEQLWEISERETGVSLPDLSPAD